MRSGRYSRRGNERWCYQQEAFLRRVVDLFDGFRDPAIRRVDAAGTPGEVHARVWEAVNRFLANLHGEGLQR